MARRNKSSDWKKETEWKEVFPFCLFFSCYTCEKMDRWIVFESAGKPESEKKDLTFGGGVIKMEV